MKIICSFLKHEKLDLKLVFNLILAALFAFALTSCNQEEDPITPTAAGETITVDLSDMTINQNSKIIVVNQKATNGVIHAIDTVLLP